MTVYIWGDLRRYENYCRAVRAAGGTVCSGDEPMNCDALLLPGGGDLEPWRYGQENKGSLNFDPERDMAEFKLLEQFTALKKPVLGICRGLQVINVFFGGTLIQDIAGHSQLLGVDRMHTVKTAPSPLLSVCGERVVVNSAHHQAVDRRGVGLQAVQWAVDGTVEALCHETLPVWAVQWHPERLEQSAGKRMLYVFLQLVKDKKVGRK